MPKAFDVQQYQANYNPNTGGQFVSVQDVLSGTSQMWGEVLQTMLKILPTAIEDILPIIEQALPELLNVFFPTDGSISPLIAAFINAVPQLATQILQLATSMAGPIVTAIANEALTLPATVISGLAGILTSIPAELLHVLPVGALSTASPTTVINPTFTADAIYGDPQDWSVDMTSTRTADGSGSAIVVADGVPHALITGSDPSYITKVGAGQSFPASIYVSHFGAAVNPGNAPVELVLYPFKGTVAQDPVQLETYTPAVVDLPWPGQKLSGSYTVPDEIDGVQWGPMLTTYATQGVYRFDDADAKQASDLSVIPGLSQALSLLNSGYQALMNGIASAARGIPIFGAEVADVVTALETINPANIVGSLGPAAIVGDIQGIINHLFGAAKNQAVDPNGTTSLIDLYNAVNQALHNTAGSDVTVFADSTTTVPVDPTWANYIDVAGFGRGQAGENAPFPLDYGQGGHAGIFNVATWVKGTHYDNTLTGVTVTVNTDGSLVFSIPGHSVTCLPGSGAQSPHIGGGWQGQAATGLTYNDKPYPGGGAQNTAGAAGLGPGGGGAGGDWFKPGGPGGPAGGWVRARANAASNPSTGADVTPPSAPTPHFVGATLTSVTITATGSVDS